LTRGRPDSLRYVVLCGGIGGVKLVAGLSRVLAPEQLAVAVNTGDDFQHLGLHISPDIDTVLYTLSGQVNPDTGWGRRDETWHFLDALGELGGETWFRLGDRDLATHVYRTRQLSLGRTLSQVTDDLRERLGVECRVLPMSDQPVATRVRTDRGTLDFQHYFVRDRAAPRVAAIEYHGAEHASAAPGVVAALADPALGAVIIAPSNPYLSIDPILAVPGMRRAIADSKAPVLAVSPIVRGAAIKGPTAKIIAELGRNASALEVLRHYQPLLDGFILDSADRELAAEAETTGIRTTAGNTIMKTPEDKQQLARSTVEFARQLTLSQ